MWQSSNLSVNYHIEGFFSQAALIKKCWACVAEEACLNIEKPHVGASVIFLEVNHIFILDAPHAALGMFVIKYILSENQNYS